MNIVNNTSQKEIIIVTGANAGLGYETTLALAEKGAKVIMACRNLSKANEAKANIQNKIPEANLEIIELDLGSLNSIRNFAKTYNSKYDRLDILVNNAGVMMPPYSKTEDGFELQMGANYLGHFLLTGLLMETILKTDNSRIVSLSSLVHKEGIINFDDLQSEKNYSRRKAYAQSKLACLMFAFELQRRLEKAGHSQTISTAAHPGLSSTDLGKSLPKPMSWIFNYLMVPFLAQAPKEGAKPTILAATGNAQGGDYFGPTGRNEVKGNPGKASFSKESKDETIAKRLWEVSEELVGFSYL